MCWAALEWSLVDASRPSRIENWLPTSVVLGCGHFQWLVHAITRHLSGFFCFRLVSSVNSLWLICQCWLVWIFRYGRTNFPPTFDNLFACISRRSRCWVRPSLTHILLLFSLLNTLVKAILPQVQAPRDLWEHFFGGSCAVLEYALGLGYPQSVPCHLLVIYFHYSCIGKNNYRSCLWLSR